MAIPATVIYFTSYDNTISYLKHHYNYNIWMPLVSGGSARSNILIEHFKSLFLNGKLSALCVTLISPLEMIRTKQQSERLKYSGTYRQFRSHLHMLSVKSIFDIVYFKELWRAIKKTTSKNGILSMWTGLGPTLLRDVPFSCENMFLFITLSYLQVLKTYNSNMSPFPLIFTCSRKR